MAYTPTVWQDRAVATPNNYTKSNETSTAVTLVQNAGTITQAGTPVNASNLNKLENGVQAVATKADAAVIRGGDTMTGALSVPTLNGTNAGGAGFDIQTNGAMDVIMFRGVSGIRFDHTTMDIYSGGNKVWNDSRLRVNSTNTGLDAYIGGAWIPMGNLPPLGKPRSVNNVSSGTAINVWTTLVNVSGVNGAIELLTVSTSPSYNATGNVRLTLDGIVETLNFNINGGPLMWVGQIPNQNAGVITAVPEALVFSTSCKVELEITSYDGTTFIAATSNLTYRLKVGTP